MAGNWNCTEDFKMDRNGEETNFQLGVVLPVNDGSVNELMLDETVIILYNSSYTWIKIDHTDQRPDQYLGS